MAFTRQLRRRIALVAIATGAGLPWAAQAQSSTVNGTVALSSQLVDRGLAITQDTAVLQGAVSIALPSGWSFGASASAELRDVSPPAEAFVQASRYWRIAPDWQFQAGLVYYDYPGRGGGAFNRTEGSVNWIYRDVLTLGVSAIYPTGSSSNRLRGPPTWPSTGRCRGIFRFPPAPAMPRPRCPTTAATPTARAAVTAITAATA